MRKADNITSLRTTLDGVTDAASAQTALPKLQEVAAQIDKVDAMIGQLSPEQRKLLAGLVNPVMPTLNQLLDAPHKQAGHMTAPDQCCKNVRKFLPRRRRPHMTQSGHARAAFAAMHGRDLLYSHRP